jgi:transcriptional regulator with XRE-family HTH domain
MPYNGEFASSSLGAQLRAFIRRAGKTQAKLADEIKADPTYVSQMVNDKVSWVNSAYFGPIVSALGITPEEVKALNPTYVIEFAVQPHRGPVPPPRQPIDLPLEIPDALQQIIDLHAKDYPELSDPVKLRRLTGHHFSDGGQLETPGQWLDFFLSVRRFLG